MAIRHNSFDKATVFTYNFNVKIFFAEYILVLIYKGVFISLQEYIKDCKTCCNLYHILCKTKNGIIMIKRKINIFSLIKLQKKL